MSGSSEPSKGAGPAPASGPASPAPQAAPSGSAWRIGVAVVVLLVMGGAAVAYWLFFLRGYVFTDDARMAGQLVDLSPDGTGRLTEVNVGSGQFVHQGDVLFRLDADIEEAQLKQAEAAVRQAQEMVHAAEAAAHLADATAQQVETTVATAAAGVAVSEAQYAKAVNGNRPEEIKAAEATVKRLADAEELATEVLARTAPLVQHGIMSKEDLDRARTDQLAAGHARESAAQALALVQAGTRVEDLAAAKAAVELARDHLAEAKANVEQAKAAALHARASVAAAQATVAQAQAAVVKAQRDVEHRSVQAPFDGWVARRWLDPGTIPLQGQPVLSLFDPTSLRVDANVEEKFLSQVAVGDEVQVKVDAYPNLALTGRVTKVLLGTNAEFSLVPAEGVSGTFIKVAQRVQLRISVGTPPELALGPGLSVTARIRIGSAQATPADAAAATAMQAALSPDATHTVVVPAPAVPSSARSSGGARP